MQHLSMSGYQSSAPSLSQSSQERRFCDESGSGSHTSRTARTGLGKGQSIPESTTSESSEEKERIAELLKRTENEIKMTMEQLKLNEERVNIYQMFTGK